MNNNGHKFLIKTEELRDIKILLLIKKGIKLEEWRDQRFIPLPNHPMYIEMELIRTDLELENAIIEDLLQAVDRAKSQRVLFLPQFHFNIENITS